MALDTGILAGMTALTKISFRPLVGSPNSDPYRFFCPTIDFFRAKKKAVSPALIFIDPF